MKLPSKFYFFQLGPTPFLLARPAPACNNKGHGYPVFRGFSSYEQPNFSGSSDYVQMRLHSSLINFLVVFTLQNINPNAVQMNIIMWLGISSLYQSKQSHHQQNNTIACYDMRAQIFRMLQGYLRYFSWCWMVSTYAVDASTIGSVFFRAFRGGNFPPEVLNFPPKQ